MRFKHVRKLYSRLADVENHMKGMRWWNSREYISLILERKSILSKIKQSW